MKYLLFAILFFSSLHLFSQEKQIEKLLDQWHLNAANARLDAYFDFIDDNGRYLGTDKTEIWSKEVFYEFCKPHFEDGKAWEFKALDRNVFLTQDQKVAWFDEVLETWMGPCRGSGILHLTPNGWKLLQYNLSVLVDNMDIKDYLEIVQKRENGEG